MNVLGNLKNHYVGNIVFIEDFFLFVIRHEEDSF